MQYLTAAIKEALRLYPPVPFIARTLDEPIEIAGYNIPAGSHNIQSARRDSHILRSQCVYISCCGALQRRRLARATCL